MSAMWRHPDKPCDPGEFAREENVIVRQNWKVFIRADGAERKVLWSQVVMPREEAERLGIRELHDGDGT